MATSSQKYMIGWNDHANNLSSFFSDILEQKELVDVTLVADGHLLNAHRLVLSAMSPYFSQMFTQMPANQQAFVFLKDVSKQTLESLITFIYRGEVSVEQGHWNEFHNIAKALKIKGLADDTRAKSLYFPAPKTTWSPPSQYQSTRTVQIGNIATPSNYYHQSSNGYQQEDDINYGDNDDNMDDSSMKHQLDVQDNQWDSNYYDNGADHNETNENVSKVKRIKRNIATATYDVIAKIRKNAGGRENVIHNGHKFCKNGQGLEKQLWRCSKASSAKCKATVSTMKINDVIMLKVLKAEHTHEADEEQ